MAMTKQAVWVYLDHAATTPVDGDVVARMLPYFSENYGNPSSIHQAGQIAEAAVEESRAKIARILDSEPDEVIFTGCGTESDNLALNGAAQINRIKKGARHILTTPVEHHAVFATVRHLAERYGFELELLPVDRFGMVDPQEVEKRVRADTAITSVIYANNEIGTINPIAEIGQICREREVPFHTDGVQAAAYLRMNVIRDNIDYLACGAHKFYGPKGVGFLYCRKDAPIEAYQTGGSQERGLRAGTHNVPLIVGMAEAFYQTQVKCQKRAETYISLRDTIIKTILENIPGSHLTGHPSQRLPNHASFVFEGVNGNDLLILLDQAGFGCSSGSACKSGSPKPSEVLLAIGLSPELALGSLRVTLGRNTTQDQITTFLEVLPGLIHHARKMAHR
ncbi:MAG TPA: cysteine desulfurase family protein [Anaerolineaceae bacterium]